MGSKSINIMCYFLNIFTTQNIEHEKEVKELVTEGREEYSFLMESRDQGVVFFYFENYRCA